MPKQINVGINGVVKTVKEVPLSINGVVKKATKGVCGVDGTVREFFNYGDYTQIQNYYLIYDRGTEYVTLNIATENSSSGGFCTKNSTNINIGKKSNDNYYWAGGIISTASAVDMTNYQTASVLLNSNSTTSTESDGGDHYGAALVASTSGTSMHVWGYTHDAWDVVPQQGRPYAVHLNISNVSGSRYMKYTCRGEHYTVYNHYVTGFVLSKTDDISTLASKAGISTATVSNILANSNILLNNYDAVQWMIKRCTGDFMVRAVSNPTFLSALNSSPFKSYVTGNAHWAKFLAMTA